MKYSIGLTVACMVLSCIQVHAKKIQLYDNWQVQSSAIVGTDGLKLPKDAGWLHATVPSTAMGVLMDNAVFPGFLLESDGYAALDASRFDVPWWWQTSFSLKPEETDSQLSLVLDGINHSAEVWVNGSPVAPGKDISGPYRRHNIDIKPFVKPGDNKLAIMVSGAANDDSGTVCGALVPGAADRNMGLFRPVWIDVTGNVAIVNPAVKSKVNKLTLDEAWLSVEATLVNKLSRPVTGVLKVKYNGREMAKGIRLRPGRNIVDMIAAEYPGLHVENPRLWWPAGMGGQPLETIDISFETDGKVSDSASVRFGIREVESYLTENRHRGFRINGKPLLIKGAAWTDDIFMRNDSVRNRIETSFIKEMGLNTLRMENFSGTSQHIYDLCDSLGIMIMPGLGSRFNACNPELAARSLADQVAWLRNHPSVIAWFVGSDTAPDVELERKYNRILGKLDDRPYMVADIEWQSPVSGSSGVKTAGPFACVEPSRWFIDGDSIAADGFFAKTGIISQVPQIESAHRIAAGQSENLQAVKLLIDSLYGGAATVDDFFRKAEWISYDGTRSVFEAFRSHIPLTTGVVHWKLNSERPALDSQLYDHYLVPTSAFYGLKKSNTPLQLIYDRGKRQVVAVNESGSKQAVNARMRCYLLHGAEGSVDTAHVEIEPNSVQAVFDLETPEQMQHVFLELADDRGLVAENYYLLGPDSELCLLDKIPGVKPVVTATKEGNTVRFTLENKSNTVAFFVRMAALDSDGQQIAPARWSDNFFSIEPGRSRVVECRFDAPRAEASFVLEGWNVPRSNIAVK